jgi:hypothetical protein|tara:strand:- start:646 stop:1623 length:978 start_codon:yes stop_codon:yes gene_type:complete
MKNRLDRLKKISLKEIWDNEAQDFTPWLAEERNLELLSETIRTPLELEAQEKDVGPFRADILCKNTEDDSWVLIENQIDKTDHKHLGQLLTYASGLQAVTIVWISAKFTEEHRAALDWLNKITDDDFRFFGLEIELWTIGDSPAAPKFNIVSKPNNWSKTISQAAKNISEGIESETKAMQYRYWQGLIDYLENNGSKLRTQDPRPRHWQTFAVGRSHFYIDATVNTRDSRLGIGLKIADKNHAKNFYNLLVLDKEEIEAEMQEKLEWRELPDNTKSEIILFKNNVNLSDKKDWNTQYGWFKTNIEKFDKVFRKRIKKLNAEDWTG